MSFYDILRSTWERERQDRKLIKLEIDFFDKAKAYSNHLEMQIDNEPDEILAELFRKRWVRVNYLINDLISLRIEKHIRDTTTGEPHPDQLPNEERDFRENLGKIITSFREGVLGIATPSDDGDFENATYQLIKFTADEKMVTVGSDLLNYGPFRKGDFALLPVENARIFLKKSKAEQIKIDI